MNWANAITFFRIALAPVLAALFLAHHAQPSAFLLTAFWVVFLVSEFSDILDGVVARAFHLTSELGKALDPFSDVISRLTLFFCLCWAGLTPIWFFLVILYREVSMTFLRFLIVQQGIVQGASVGGKIKAWLYFAASVGGFLVYSLPEVAAWEPSAWILQGLYLVAAGQSLFSFGLYFRGYLQLRKNRTPGAL